MRKCLNIFICTVFMSILLSNAYANAQDGITKGDTLFTRSNLRAQGSTVYFHNMSALNVIVPVATEVLITGTTGKSISFKVVSIGKSYRLADKSSAYEKYFVKSKDEIGLESMTDKAQEAIGGMTVYSGMTKAEAFASLGCPAYIAYGVKSWGHSFNALMASDIWYYNLNTRKKDMIVEFENGIVTKVTDRIGLKKVKEK
jgi:hypothetical protein